MSTVWAWLLTYLVHSTCFLSAAWLASRWLAQRPRWEELVWRFAMVGAVVTTLWQATSPAEPLAGVWRVTAEATAEATPVVVSVRTSATETPRQTEAPGQIAATPALPEREQRALAQLESPASAPRAEALAPTSRHIHAAPTAYPLSGSSAAAGWLTAAVALSLLLAAAWYTLLRRLRSRVEITEGPLAEMLHRLCRQAGVTRRVRLFETPAIDGPLALGWWRPQICVPPRAVVELSSAQQELMLAHELGHVVRCDPAWQTLYRAIEWLAFFQPLHRLGRRRLEDLAEELADAWAAEQTGQGATLAGVLVQVAEWLVHDRLEVAAVGMARRRSPLAQRVARLLAPTTSHTTPRLLVAGLLMGLGVAAAGLPGVGLAGPAEREVPSVRRLAPTGERAVESKVASKVESEDKPGDVRAERDPMPGDERPAPPPRRRSGPPPKAELLEELAQLDDDLAELAAEVRELRPLLESHPSGPALRPLVQRMTERIENLRARRETYWRSESQRR